MWWQRSVSTLARVRTCLADCTKPLVYGVWLIINEVFTWYVAICVFFRKHNVLDMISLRYCLRGFSLTHSQLETFGCILHSVATECPGPWTPDHQYPQSWLNNDYTESLSHNDISATLATITWSTYLGVNPKCYVTGWSRHSQEVHGVSFGNIWRQGSGPTLARLKACLLDGTKPLPEPLYD